LNDQERLTYVRFRLDRAAGTLKEARTLFDSEQMFGAVNRIYYAMFYAVSALAFSRGFQRHHTVNCADISTGNLLKPASSPYIMVRHMV